MSEFKEAMRKQGLRSLTKKVDPVWSGPGGSGPNGGVTFSLLSRFLTCRARFKALVYDGLEPAPTFNHKIEYGNMWHTCEEAHAANLDWQPPLRLYAEELLRRYKFNHEDIHKWFHVCKMQFPEYVKFWKNHGDVKNRKPILQEQVFSVPYKLPSGRTVFLRGKWDSVDLIKDEGEQYILLQENKTKGQIEEGKIRRQLKWDLQTMLYLIALEEYRAISGNGAKSLKWSHKHYRLFGVLYNVVKRPLSQGKGCIRQKQSETEKEYYGRLAQYIKDEPTTYFMRWKIGVSPGDIENFKKKTLDPLLEHLYDWWNEVAEVKWTVPIGYKTPLHWTHPFGCFNILDEGGSTDLDDYVLSGSTVGLKRTENLFPELS